MPRTAAKFRALTESERRERGRRLRLEWASGGDREHAERVERAIAKAPPHLRLRGVGR